MDYTRAERAEHWRKDRKNRARYYYQRGPMRKHREGQYEGQLIPFPAWRYMAWDMEAQCFYCDDISDSLARKDPDLGYTSSNCVPACTLCMRLKSGLTDDEFRSHINKIARNAKKGLSNIGDMW